MTCQVHFKGKKLAVVLGGWVYALRTPLDTESKPDCLNADTRLPIKTERLRNGLQFLSALCLSNSVARIASDLICFSL